MLEKLVKKLMKKEIVNLEPFCRFQPNAIPIKLRRDFTCENFSSIALKLITFCVSFEEKKENIKDRLGSILHAEFHPDS